MRDTNLLLLNWRAEVTKIHIVTGNHISEWGIVDIVEVLKSALGDLCDFSQSPFLVPDKTNLVIEEFSNPNFTKYLLDSGSQLILVLTEFPTIILGRLYLNRFGFKASKFFLAIDAILSPFYKTIGKVSRGRVQSFAYSRNYWRSREKSLRYVFSKGVVQSLITLHPEITKRIQVLTKLNLIKAFTVYPIIKNPNIFTGKLPYKGMFFATFGSLSRYRIREIKKANKYLPSGVIRITDELANDIMRRIISNNMETIPTKKGLELNQVGFASKFTDPSELILDFYFRNSTRWNYLSPIRIARSINRERPVIYIGNRLEDHPINDLVLQISNHNQLLPKLEKINDELASSEKKINNYNNFARSENTKFIEAFNADFK